MRPGGERSALGFEVGEQIAFELGERRPALVRLVDPERSLPAINSVGVQVFDRLIGEAEQALKRPIGIARSLVPASFELGGGVLGQCDS
jgi:hypothetical protein